MLKKIFRLKFFICSITILALTGIAPLATAAKKQNIFVDKNGMPIPMDILEFLSSSKPSKAGKKLSKKASTTKKKLQLKGKDKKSKRRRSTPEKEKALLEALLIGNTARAMQLTKSGVKASYKNYKGETPLSVSVSKAWASMVRELLDHGANINQKMPSGLSLLHHASSRGYTDVAKLLIKYGLNPSTKSKRKEWNSLHVAARYGHWQLVQLYVRMGVDPNQRTSDGKTALEIAQIIRHQGIIKILSQVTSARPTGRAANYDRRQNRLQYQVIANKKREKLQKKRDLVKSRMRLLRERKAK